MNGDRRGGVAVVAGRGGRSGEQAHCGHCGWRSEVWWGVPGLAIYALVEHNQALHDASPHAAGTAETARVTDA